MNCAETMKFAAHVHCYIAFAYNTRTEGTQPSVTQIQDNTACEQMQREGVSTSTAAAASSSGGRFGIGNAFGSLWSFIPIGFIFRGRDETAVASST